MTIWILISMNINQALYLHPFISLINWYFPNHLTFKTHFLPDISTFTINNMCSQTPHEGASRWLGKYTYVTFGCLHEDAESAMVTELKKATRSLDNTICCLYLRHFRVNTTSWCKQHRETHLWRHKHDTRWSQVTEYTPFLCLFQLYRSIK